MDPLVWVCLHSIMLEFDLLYLKLTNLKSGTIKPLSLTAKTIELSDRQNKTSLIEPASWNLYYK